MSKQGFIKIVAVVAIGAIALLMVIATTWWYEDYKADQHSICCGGQTNVNVNANTNSNANTTVSTNQNSNQSSNQNTNAAVTYANCTEGCVQYGYTKGTCEREGSSLESLERQEANITLGTLSDGTATVTDCDFSAIGSWDVCYCTR